MNEEDNSSTPSNLHTWIDPEMEARIVALILGEASDFESEELERIMADNPEMRAFRRRIEEIHNALGELKVGSETGKLDDDWKLSEEKRGALDAIFSFQSIDGKTESGKETEEGQTRSSWKIIPMGNWRKISKIAAVVGVLLAVGAIVFIGSLPGGIYTQLDFAESAEMSAPSVEAESRYDDFRGGEDMAAFELAENSASDNFKTQAPPAPGSSYESITDAGDLSDYASEESTESFFAKSDSDFRERKGESNHETVTKGEDMIEGLQLAQTWKEVNANSERNNGFKQQAAAPALEGREEDRRKSGEMPGRDFLSELAKQSGEQIARPAEPSFEAPVEDPTNRQSGGLDELLAEKDGKPADQSLLDGKDLLAGVNKNLSDRTKSDSSLVPVDNLVDTIEKRESQVRHKLSEPSSPITPATPTAFESRNRGVTLGVDPIASATRPSAEMPPPPGIAGKAIPDGMLKVSDAESLPEEQREIGRLGLDKESADHFFENTKELPKPASELRPKSKELEEASEDLDSDNVEVSSRRKGEKGIVTDSRDFLNLPEANSRIDRISQDSKDDGEPNSSNYWYFDAVPNLGDLPVTGRLFRQKASDEKLEAENRREERDRGEAKLKFSLLSSETLDMSGKLNPTDSPAEIEIFREFLPQEEYDSPEIPAATAPSAHPVVPSYRAPLKSPPAGLDEKSAAAEPFSTFSLNVSDVSFKLAKASLDKGEWPEADKIRIEEFVNAFDYGDPLPSQKDRVACRVEQAVHPFLQQRNLVRIAMRTGAAGRSAETPLKLTFLLDNSGSMERADRQATVRRAFAELAAQLKPNDQVTLISFARQPRLLADKVGGEQANDLITAVKNMPSEGGTNLEAALNLAFEKAKEQQADGAQNRIILLTDGAANLGDADPETLSKKIETFREAGIAFDAAGIVADGLNDETLEALTRKGDGRYYLLDSPEDADSGFAEKIAGALRPSAKNVKVQVEFNPERVGSYKLLGFEKHRLNKEDFRNDAVDAAEMAAEETGVAVYQIEALPQGTGDIGSVSVRFRDLSSDAMVEKRWPISYAASSPQPDQASASMRLASAASMFAAKLKGDPLGATVDLESVAKLITGLPEPYSKMERVTELQTMVAKARELEGNR